MPKIEYILFNYENVVIFKIISMDERFRAERIQNIFQPKSVKDFIVYSHNEPACFENGIYLRGWYRNHDNNACAFAFDTVQKAKDYIHTAQAALVDWAANWEGFKKKEKKQYYLEVKMKTSVYRIW